MGQSQKSLGEASIYVENIGGIEEASIEFSPGVTVLVGRNATNRTSLLQGLMAALGSKKASIKADSDEARAELTIGDETYTHRLVRRSGTVKSEGSSYKEDPTLAELFSFLLESNEARQAVARGDDLRDLIMRPVDTEAIEAELDQLVDERKELEAELNEIDSLKEKLPGLEEERTRLEKQIEERHADLEAAEEELRDTDANVEETQHKKNEIEEKFEELRSERSELDDVRYDLQTKRETLDALRKEKRELEAEQGSLPETPKGKLKEVETRINRLRERKEALQTEVNDLQSVIGFNEGMLDGSGEKPFDALENDEETNSSVTDQLVKDEVTCWTCGSRIASDQIHSTIDTLREFSQKKIKETKEIDQEVSNLQEEKQNLEKSQRERDRIDRKITRLENETRQSKAQIDRLQERREELTASVEQIEQTIGGMEDDSYSEILDIHREANQLEYELGKLESDRDRVVENIESIESRLAQEDDIRTQRKDIQSEIEDLRDRIERIEREAVEHFNEHMDVLLDLLEYENLDRIWLERVEQEVRKGRRKVDKSVFEVHVIRSTESGAAYEDTVDHLSESEREVTGLVFAVAGYLAHEVYDTVPFMILDSLEAIDAERIATLIDYLKDYTGYLLVALLPEDANALPPEYDRVTDI